MIGIAFGYILLHLTNICNVPYFSPCTKSNEILRSSFITMPVAFESSLKKLIELCEEPTNTVKVMRRSYVKEVMERVGHDAKIHSIHSYNIVKLLCFIGDTVDGLNSAKFLYYFYNAWMLIRLSVR